MNGCQGIVKKIWYSPGSDPTKVLPSVVFVKFEGYSGKSALILNCSHLLTPVPGPETPGWEGVDPSWIPITAITAQWENKAGKALSRTQLPLTMAWAITIHKSQGLTLTNVVIELGPKDFSAGLSFVAISRIKTLGGLAFRSHFPWSRIQRPEESDAMKMLREDDEHRSALGFSLDDYGMDLSEYVFAE